MDAVDSLLKRFNFDVARAADAHFEGIRCPEASEESPMRAPSNVEMDRSDRSGFSKRARPETPQSAAAGATFPTTPAPFYTAAMGSLGSIGEQEGSTSQGASMAQLVGMMGVMALEIQALKEKVVSLPSALTGVIPAAVRAHDENEQILARQAVENSRLGGVMATIDRAQSMADLGNIDGVTWDASQNFLKCDDCFRYASFAPPNLKFGTSTRSGQEREGAGVILGVNLVRRESDNRVCRGMSAVRFSLKSHMASDLHEWCNLHAVEKKSIESTRVSAGLNLARLALQTVKEHNADHSYERAVSTAKALGLNVGTKNHSRKFLPRIRKSMRAVLNETFMTLLTEPDPATKRPPAFAVMADKATLLHRTGQMVGIILMIAGVLTPIFYPH